MICLECIYSQACTSCNPMFATAGSSKGFNRIVQGCFHGKKGEAGRSEHSICHDISHSSQPRVSRGDVKVVWARGSFSKCVCCSLLNNFYH